MKQSVLRRGYASNQSILRPGDVDQGVGPSYLVAANLSEGKPLEEEKKNHQSSLPATRGPASRLSRLGGISCVGDTMLFIPNAFC